MGYLFTTAPRKGLTSDLTVTSASFSNPTDLRYESESLYKWDGTNWFRWGGPNLHDAGYTPCHDFPFVCSDGPGGDDNRRLGYYNGLTAAADATNTYVAGRTDTNGDFVVMKWDGTTWSQMGGAFQVPGPAFTDFYVDYRVLFPAPRLSCLNGALFAFGGFTSIGGDSSLAYIARWNPTSSAWEAVGTALNGPVMAINSLKGRIIAGGYFSAAGGNPEATRIAQWDGTNWLNLGPGIVGTNNTYSTSDYITIDNVVLSLAVCDTNLYVGGDFTTAGNITNANGFAIWNGSDWSGAGGGLTRDTNRTAPSNFSMGSFSPGSRAVVFTITPHGNSVYVGGYFSDAHNPDGGDIPVASIARATWDESSQLWTWSDLDYGVTAGTSASPADNPLGVVVTTAIVNGPTPTSYNVFVGGGFAMTGSLGDRNYMNVAWWRVGYPQPPSAPLVKITVPGAYSSFTNDPAHPLTNTITALATSTYTNIASVTFTADGASSAGVSNTDGSFRFDYTPGIGIHTVYAQATDASSWVGKSAPIFIAVQDPTNTAISARPDYYTFPANTPAVALQVLTNDTPASGLRIGGVFSIQNLVPATPLGGLATALGTIAVSHDRTYLTYTPFPNSFGTDVFYYTVTNSTGAFDLATVTVDIHAPVTVVIDSAPEQLNASTAGSIIASASSGDRNASITNISLYLGGSLIGQSTNSPLSVSWSATTPGFYTFIAVAADNSGFTNSSSPVMIAVTNSSTSGDVLTAQITNLPTTVASTGDVIFYPVRQGLFDLRGAARNSNTNDPVAYQVLLYQPNETDAPYADVTPKPVDANGFHPGGDTNGDLGMLDFTTIPNGVYDLVLNVFGPGSQASVTNRFSLDTPLKIGQFSFSQQDMIIPASGIPLTIVRTYNSLNPDSADFGYSWTFAINSMDVVLDEERTDVTIGSDSAPYSDGDSGDGLPPVVSIRTGGGRDVTLTLPNGRRTTFVYSPVARPLFDVAQWVAPPDVHATLTSLRSAEIDFFPSLFWKDGGDNSTVR